MSVAQSWIGRSVPRLEDERLLRGEGRFVDDLRLPGALAVAFLRSPHAHARMRHIDTSAAAALPGVVAVFDGPTLARRIDLLVGAPRTVVPAIQEAARPRLYPDRRPVLALDRVRYVGEPVAVVIAESRYLAEDALDLIDVDYEPLPPVVTMDDALHPDAPRLHDEWPNNIGLTFEVTKGDAEKAFSAAHLVLRDRLYTHRYTGIPIETRGVAAMPEPHGGQVTVWSSTQAPHSLRDRIATFLGLPRDRVRVVAPDVGGGFGVKGQSYSEDALIAFLARELGRPLKWIEDRREHFVSTTHARDQAHEMEVAFDAQGHVLGLRDRITCDVGAYNLLGIVVPYNTVAHLFGPYEVPAAHFDVRSVRTNKTPLSAYRGAGRPEAVFALERMLERAALALSIDPAELRQRNLVPAESMPYDTGLLYRDGQPMVYDSGDYPRMYRRALELLEYDRWRRVQAQGTENGRLIGIGLARLR